MESEYETKSARRRTREKEQRGNSRLFIRIVYLGPFFLQLPREHILKKN